jgi:hypothetical protein
MPVSRAVRGIIVGFSLVVLVLSSALPASADSAASKWKVGYYTPSNPGTLSMSSAIQGGGIASFGFTNLPNTALLVTTHGSFKGQLLGDLTGKTLTATFEISGTTGAFTYFGEGTPENPCGTPASVRMFFTTDNSGGFAFTHYWWSNPESQVLGNGAFTLTATVEPAEWSDWNGQNGATQTAGFADAASNVTVVGFSFGGGCFFENGVGTTDGSGTFQLDSFTTS